MDRENWEFSGVPFQIDATIPLIFIITESPFFFAGFFLLSMLSISIEDEKYSFGKMASFSGYVTH